MIFKRSLGLFKIPRGRLKLYTIPRASFILFVHYPMRTLGLMAQKMHVQIIYLYDGNIVWPIPNVRL